jgi:Mitochondrial carrier protein
VSKRPCSPETSGFTFVGTRGWNQVFTNPLEIVKIRLQMQGEAAKAGKVPVRGAGHIIQQLGLFGLYKGSAAWYENIVASTLALIPVALLIIIILITVSFEVCGGWTYYGKCGRSRINVSRCCRCSVQCHLLHGLLAFENRYL